MMDPILELRVPLDLFILCSDVINACRVCNTEM